MLTGLAIALTAVCVWIVIPPFAVPLLIAATLAIEWSPYLLALNIALLLLALRAKTWSRWAASGLSLVNVVLCTIPIVALLAGPRSDGPPLENAHPLRAGPWLVLERDAQAVSPEFVSHMREYRPPLSVRCPPVIFAVYGGAWQRGSATNEGGLNRALAARGFDVFALDYRHAPAFHFPAQLDDINRQIDSVVQGLVQQGCPSKGAALLGHSAGGELAMTAAYTRRDIRAVVSYSGPIDLDQAYRIPPQPDPLDVRALLRAYLGGAPAAAREAYRASSPLMLVRSHLPPTLLLYAGRDHVVDIRAPMELRDALRAHGDEVTFVQFPWAEHGFEEVPFGLHGRLALDATVAFLNRTQAP